MQALDGVNLAARVGIALGATERQLDIEVGAFADAVISYVAEVADEGEELPEAQLGLADFQFDSAAAHFERVRQLRGELAAAAH